METERLKRLKRSQYKSLGEFAREEGIEAVLSFLSYNPTQVNGVYRHTQMPVINGYRVTKNTITSLYQIS